MSSTRIPVTGFKECDIRGEVGGEITGEFAYALGRALGTRAQSSAVIIGGDFRTSTPVLLEELQRGVLNSGKDVVNLGQVTTPAYYFARRQSGIKTGAMITASHNPPTWNGFKLILGATPISPGELDAVKHLILSGDFATGSGSAQQKDIKAAYVDWLAERFAPLKGNAPHMVLDCGNGATGWVIHAVNQALDLNAHITLDTPDGTFPHRHPDIAKPTDLALLQSEVLAQGAQIGAGFDGDGDRVGIVDHTGRRIPSDHLIAWLAGELLKQHPGAAVVYDLKLSQAVADTVAQRGGRQVPQKSGHTFIKTAMLAHDAVFGGEYSGHLFFREINGEDDALFAALLIASLVVAGGQPLTDLLADIPRYVSTPDIRVRYTGDRAALIQQAITRTEANGEQVIQIDGIKVIYNDGWALMRASVTEPAFTLRFEGRDPAQLRHVAERFLRYVEAVRDPVWTEVLEHTQSE